MTGERRQRAMATDRRASFPKKKRLLPPGCACVCTGEVEKRERDGVKDTEGRKEWENDRCSSRPSPWESARKREGPSEQQQHSTIDKRNSKKHEMAACALGQRRR